MGPTNQPNLTHVTSRKSYTDVFVWDLMASLVSSMVYRWGFSESRGSTGPKCWTSPRGLRTTPMDVIPYTRVIWEEGPSTEEFPPPDRWESGPLWLLVDMGGPTRLLAVPVLGMWTSITLEGQLRKPLSSPQPWSQFLPGFFQCWAIS